MALFPLTGITAAALATGACIVGILCLPLILLLVYRQRQVASNRREYPRLPGGGGESVSDALQPPAQPLGSAKARGRHISSLFQKLLESLQGEWWREEGTHVCHLGGLSAHQPQVVLARHSVNVD